MNLPRHALHAILIGLASATFFTAAVFAQDQAPAGPKLYRWVGPDGKVHYGDDIPADALNQAREELSKKTGMTIRQVDRALTPEERAAAEAKAQADAKAAEALAQAKQNDQVLVSSYPTEDDLKRAYNERIAAQIVGLKAIRMGLENQQKSLASFLYAASTKELSGKPVEAGMVASITKLHESVVDQQQSQVQTEAQVANLKQEGAAILARYRDLKAASAKEFSGGSTPTPPPASPPKG